MEDTHTHTHTPLNNRFNGCMPTHFYTVYTFLPTKPCQRTTKPLAAFVVPAALLREPQVAPHDLRPVHRHAYQSWYWSCHWPTHPHQGSNECPDQTEMTPGEKPELMHQWIFGFEQISSEFPVLHMPNIGRIGRYDILKVLARHSSYFKIIWIWCTHG